MRPFLLSLSLLAIAIPVLSQGSKLMEKEQLQSFLAGLRRDSQRWTGTVSSIDVALISGPTNPQTKVMEKSQRACLNAVSNLSAAIAALEKKNSIGNQMAVLKGLSNTSDRLSALQDVLSFEDSIKPGGVADVAKWEKWEKWENGLTNSFEQSAADETKMYDHMTALTQIVDSRIDAGTITNNSARPVNKSQ